MGGENQCHRLAGYGGSLRAAIPVATMLRQGLLEVSQTRALSDGQHTRPKWFTSTSSPRFRQRVEAIVEAFSGMQDDLDKERKVIMKQWAKRRAQIEIVMNSTVGMYGDLQGIAGKSLQEIEGLEWLHGNSDETIPKQLTI